MLIPCYCKLGFQGNETLIARVPLNDNTVGTTAGFCGSYHILSMGRHYRAYVVTGIFPRFPDCAGLPPSHPYMELGRKQRAAGVTGNIGEVATGIIGLRVLNLNINEVTHVKPGPTFGRRKTPDYMLRAGHNLPGRLQPVWPAGFGLNLPEWWPAESKARPTASAVSVAVKTEAFPQLAAFWHTIQNGFPDDVGFGMAVGLAYENPARITITLFLPRNQPALLAHLAASTYTDYRDNFVNDT